MKKILPYTGVIAALLAIVPFILIMTTPITIYQTTVFGATVTYEFQGIIALFGGVQKGILGTDVEFVLSPDALVSWILLMVGIVLLLAAFFLPLAKVQAVQRFAGLMNLVAALVLVVGGVMLFLAKNDFLSVNELGTDGYQATAGWIISGILALAAGVCATVPSIADFVEKLPKQKKKKSKK